MRWLNRRLRSERGASAVLVGLLLVPLLGFVAISVDVGVLYAEKAQLQNGADAAALAIAQDCANEGCSTSGVLDSLAATYTGENANDSAANSSYSFGDHTVTVTDSTLTAGGEDEVQHYFASFIGVDSSAVGAEATAVWEGPGSGPAVLPLAISVCEFNLFGGLNDGVRHTLRYNENHPCRNNDIDVPGGFGWLDQTAGTCSVQVDIDNESVPSNPGNNQPTDCEATLAGLEGTTVLIPVFDESWGSGQNGEFHIYAFAAFTVTGWKFAGGNRMPFVNVDNYPGCACNGGSDRFIQGYFEKWVSIDSAFGGGGPILNGTTIVRLIK